MKLCYVFWYVTAFVSLALGAVDISWESASRDFAGHQQEPNTQTLAQYQVEATPLTLRPR